MILRSIILSATMLRSLALFILAVAVNAQAPCTTDADCTEGGDPKCVVESEYYAACVDCSPDSFPSQCSTMSADFLEAAEATCDMGCDGRCPTGSNTDCSNSTTGSSCVKTQSTDACMDCSDQDVFVQECFYQPPDFVIAAEAKCQLDCTGRCPHHTDAECPADQTCVVQEDGYFDECVDCNPVPYQEECIYLSDEMRTAADEACGLTCVMNATTATTAASGANGLGKQQQPRVAAPRPVPAEVIKSALLFKAE